MEGLKDIEFFQIPIEWHSVKLGSEKPLVLEEIRTGLTISQNKDGGNFKVSRIETISESIIDESRVQYISEITKEKIEKYLIKKGDILFSHINSDPHLGKTAIAERDYDDLLHGMNLLLFRANKSIIEPEFLNYIFNLYRDIGVFVRIRSRAVNQSSINQNKLKNLEIPLPELPEQRKIVHVLSKVQKAIEQQDNLIRTTTELKKALMQKLFMEGTIGETQKETEIGLVPGSWGVASINQTKTLMQYGTSVKCDYKTEGVPVIRIPNVISGKVDVSDLKFGKPKRNELEKLKLNKGDLIFVRTNGAKELSGRCAIFNNEIDNCYYASYLIRLQLDDNKVIPDFINYYAQTELGKSFLSGKAIRTADGKYNINTGILNNVLYPLPGLNEQKEIVYIISLMEEKIAFQNKKKQTLTSLFKILLHELMTGQRRVHEVEFNKDLTL